MKKKSMLSLLILLIFTLLVSSKDFSVYASNKALNSDSLVEIGETSIDLNSIGPLAIEVCYGYSSHDAVSRGWGVIYRGVYPDTSNRVFEGQGACWQCSRCKIVLITEFDPLLTGYVGYYASYNPGYVIPIYGAVMWTNNVYYSSGSKVPYFAMRYY